MGQHAGLDLKIHPVLAFCVSSVVKCLFMLLANFLIGMFICCEFCEILFTF